MHTLEFEVAFHGPLLPTTGHAAAGFDASVDLDEPLTGTALKGLMRASARDLLDVPDDLLTNVYGAEAIASPWHWVIVEQPVVVPVRRTRVSIDETTHAARDNQLVFSRAAVAKSRASFVVEGGGRLSAAELGLHRRVLTASARGCHAMGAARRRGLGWISISGGEDLTGQFAAIASRGWTA